MMVVCVEDKQDNGFFRTKMEKVEGLTKGRPYHAMLFSDASGQHTSTTPKFLVFNDNEEWETYSVKLFEPYER